MSEAGDLAAFERIRRYLQEARGFDFTAYKRTTVMRRTIKRMHAIGVGGFDAYLDYLQVHPDEFASLFNTILINVTSFFRDADVWEVVQSTITPQILQAHGTGEGIRVWSAGCASGQEAYTAAIVLAEAMGLDAYKERVKIYATDVDEEALTEARQAIYPAKHVEECVPPALIQKYFERTGDAYAVSRELRRAVIFGRHDLIQDAPISRVDLLLCRNTLMYFNAEAQGRIMGRFYFSVMPGGFVVLGRAEMLFSHAATFQPVDLKRRIFKTIPKANHRERLFLLGQSAREDVMAQYPDHRRVREAAFDTNSDAQIVLDQAGVLIAANAAARKQFKLASGDIGAPFQDLELSYRPAELRLSLERARQERRDIALNSVPTEQNGVIRFVDILLAPLFEDDGTPLGTRISFTDVTPIKSLQDELVHSKQELETAYEELQSTNEELETTNEELQSTVEELETTNEELQSTNEELETMNEELQSTNEELQTMNDELRNRSTELNSTNAFLESVFTSLRSAVVVLDRDMRVLVWNAGASNLWGLRADEAQRVSFFTLDIGLPVGDLHHPIRDVLSGAAGHREVTVRATSRKGKSIACRIAISPLMAGNRAVSGAILLMEEAAAA
jgi:two-component system, chemotaxis family, CheB/CheR fusion protein